MYTFLPVHRPVIAFTFIEVIAVSVLNHTVELAVGMGGWIVVPVRSYVGRSLALAVLYLEKKILIDDLFESQTDKDL